MSSNGKEPVIVIRDMTKVYRMGEYEVRALNGVSVEIDAGDFVAIMGPSGSGRSTMMNMLGALDQPTRGQLIVEVYHPRLAGPVPHAEDVIAAATRNIGDIDVDDERSLIAALRDAVADAQPVPRPAR